MASKPHDCNATTRWIEQPPNSPHRYRVECSRCGKYIKWGNDNQLLAANTAGTVGRIVKAALPATKGEQVAFPPSDDDESPF